MFYGPLFRLFPFYGRIDLIISKRQKNEGKFPTLEDLLQDIVTFQDSGKFRYDSDLSSATNCQLTHFLPKIPLWHQDFLRLLDDSATYGRP